MLFDMAWMISSGHWWNLAVVNRAEIGLRWAPFLTIFVLRNSATRRPTVLTPDPSEVTTAEFIVDSLRVSLANIRSKAHPPEILTRVGSSWHAIQWYWSNHSNVTRIMSNARRMVANL